MDKKGLQAIFLQTMPVMAGYVSLGIAFGILLKEAGYGVLWAFGMGTLIYAGASQFLCVTLLMAHASLLQVAILVFVLNFRHFFYGLGMITRYKGEGRRRPYLIYALTDETFALLSAGKPPEGVSRSDFYFWTSFLDQCYWVLGSVVGSLAGSLITFDTTGLDFAMTALFAVLVVEQWYTAGDHRPALIGLGISVLALRIFGADNFLIPALVVICILLLILPEKQPGSTASDAAAGAQANELGNAQQAAGTQAEKIGDTQQAAGPKARITAETETEEKAQMTAETGTEEKIQITDKAETEEKTQMTEKLLLTEEEAMDHDENL